MAHPKSGKKRKSPGAEVKSPAADEAVSRTAVRRTLAPPHAQKAVVWAVCAALAAACVAVYGQTLAHDFINFDDNVYVTENPYVQAGLNLRSLGWAFYTDVAAYLHPLTWMSHMLDCTLYGLQPWGHHLTNLLFHTAASVLLFLSLRLLTGALWPSAAVAALFAVHPLHVESVAWVAERKDVLSAFWWMLALGAYGLYARRGGALRYAAVAAAFILGLMSKPMVVTLPCALLLLDYWPLDRVGCTAPAGVMIQKSVRLAAEKIPLFVITALSALSTMVMQSAGDNLSFGEKVPPLARCANAVVVYVLYLVKTVWPSGLAPFYPHPIMRPAWQVAGAALVLCAITAFCLREARRRPYLIVGWLWYLGTLVPVMELVQAGEFSHADRYTYLPSIGVYIMIAWGAADLAAAWRVPNRVMAALSGGALAALTVCAVIQTSHWRNDASLFGHTLAVGQESSLALTNMGLVAKKEKRYDEAEAHFKRALELNPGYVNAINDLGVLAMDQKKYGEAEAYLKRTLELNPKQVAALYNSGVVAKEQQRYDEARTYLQKALEVDPAYVSALSSLGSVAMEQGQNEEAVKYFNKTLDLKPNHVGALNNLANIAMGQGRNDDARGCLIRALDADPKCIAALNTLGLLTMNQGNYEESAGWLAKALDADPKDLKTLTNLSGLAAVQKRYDEAKQYLMKALELDPGYAVALQNLGRLAKEQGHEDEAREWLAKAVGANPKDAQALNALGTAAVAQGRFDEALTHLTKALELDPKNVEVLYNLGVAAKGGKKYDEAKRHFTRVLELDPKYVKAVNNLGVLAMEQGNADEAVAHLKKALELKPDHANALANLGKLSMDRKDFDEAKTYLKKALELDPKNVPALYNLGLCLMSQEQYEEAQASFKKTLEIDPNYIRSMKALSAVLSNLGRQEEADGYAKKAAELEQARGGK